VIENDVVPRGGMKKKSIVPGGGMIKNGWWLFPREMEFIAVLG